MKTLLGRLLVAGLGLFFALTAGAQPVTKVAAGSLSSYFLKSDGSLWAMGLNSYGQLGDGTSGFYNKTNLPEQIVSSNVTAVATGGGFIGDFGQGPWGHTLFLKSDGSLWDMGYNRLGELGDGTIKNTNRPEQIVASNVTAIAAGAYHSLFLKNDGSLWGMGSAGFGALGLASSTHIPQMIVASGVTAIAAAGFDSYFIKSDGSLWGMGENTFGSLGDGTYTNAPLPERLVSSNVTAIAAGGDPEISYSIVHALFLKSDGSLWAMGYNSYGQLGDGIFATNAPYGTNQPEMIVASNVTAIAAGSFHSLFRKSDGSLWVMGYNTSGELGDGTGNNTNRPEQIVAGNVIAIAGGYDQSLFVRSDGSLWAMGGNSYGELGDGTYNSSNLPEQILAAYNRIAGQLLGDGTMQLSFVGVAGRNYALDRSFRLSPANWLPQATNAADALGNLIFTNAPDPTTNDFWRIRSVP